MTICTPSLPDPTAVSAATETAAVVGRARWLDAMRGFTMLCLISRGFGFPRLAAYGWRGRLSISLIMPNGPA